VTSWRVWLVFGVIGAGTFVLRISFIAFWGRVRAVPPTLQRALRFIPPAVLSALVLPSLTVSAGALSLGSRSIAGVVAMFVAWRSKSVFATIVAGMAALWVLQAIM
jgi:branched-subunit amino acid transport protein